MSGPRVLAKIRQYPLAVVCVIVFTVLVALIFVRKEVVETLSTTEDGLASRLGVIKSNQQNAPGLSDELEILESKVEVLRERLFNRDQRAINTDFFYNMEDSVDAVILEVSQTGAVHAATAENGPFALRDHEVIVFNVSIRGTFREIVDFMYQVHQVEPFVRISDFEVRGTGRSKDVGGGSLSARLQVLVLAELQEDES